MDAKTTRQGVTIARDFTTIGNQVVIAGAAMHSFEIDSGAATFTSAGLYAISIQYFENSGYTSLEFWASNPLGPA